MAGGSWRRDPSDTPCKEGGPIGRHSPFVDDEGRCEWCGKRINTPGYERPKGSGDWQDELNLELRLHKRSDEEHYGQLDDCPAHPGVPAIECDCG